MTEVSRKFILVYAIIISLLTGCATIKKQVMQDDNLKIRVKNLYSAIAKNDYKTWYEIESPNAMRDNMTLEAWKKYMGLDNSEKQLTNPLNIVEGQLEQVCSCTPMKYMNGMNTLMCSLLVNLVTEESEGHPKSYRVLAEWELFNGEWYHHFTDSAEVEYCPKDYY